MGKRKIDTHSHKENGVSAIPSFHNFSDLEVKDVRKDLLSWYDSNKRDLPWRTLATDLDINRRAYAVWVSEIMLQQTQVATVIDYYIKWMKEVNEMWSGLGYYSRGRRLHEGAKKIVDELDGEMPRTADNLLKHIPGVGKYTAGAVASISYNQATGIVDGNVIRVLCRLRNIGAESNGQVVTDSLWSLANLLVDPDRPGDFNQGLMELGATVCNPKSPDCAHCPLNNNCKAYAKVQQEKMKSTDKLVTRNSEVELVDIECLTDNCRLCLPITEVYDPSIGVMNFPRKGKKKAAREETTTVCIICKKSQTEDEFLITQRPNKGLLAGLWEFPSQLNDSRGDISYSNILHNHGVKLTGEYTRKDCGEVVHIFSHIHQTYRVMTVSVDDSDISVEDVCKRKWVTRQQFLEAAVSTAMKKVFKTYEAAVNSDKKPKHTKIKAKTDTNQKSIQDFFKRKH